MKNLVIILCVIVSVLGLGACIDPIATPETTPALESHSISFQANQGTGIMDDQIVQAGMPVKITTNVFTRIGYLFTGWNTGVDGNLTGFADGANLTMGNSDLTLYAQWGPATNMIHFNANGGTGSMSGQPLATGASSPLSANTFTRAGYIFAGWSLDAGSSVVVYTDEVLFTMGTSSTTLFAVWTPTSQKSLLSFGFGTPAVAGTFNGNAISVLVPVGTVLTNLQAIFAITGASVKIGGLEQVSGVSVNDFSNPVTYTVVAGDGSTAIYTVTVMVRYALWAATTSSGALGCEFKGLGTDDIGNSYAVGSISGTEIYGFGSGASVTGANSRSSGLIVKYDELGKAQWARTLEPGSGHCMYYAVAVDGAGNSYAVGFIQGNGNFGFGDGVALTGPSLYNNLVLVKYNSAGVAQWAKTSSSAPSNTILYGVALDGSGNIIVSGYQVGTGSFGFGNGVSVAGTSTSFNLVCVKYDATGVAQWAKSTSAGADSVSNGLAADSFGNVYLAGYIKGTGLFGFGNGITASGVNSASNAIIVKYNANGSTQWARTPVSGSSYSIFQGVALDASGNSFAVGSINGNGAFGFGAGISVAGACVTSDNVIIVKYNSLGTVQWAKSVNPGPTSSLFNAVTVDGVGGIYAAGRLSSSVSYGFGNGVTARGSGTCSSLIVKYSQSGDAQWAQTQTAGDNSGFSGVAVDSSNKAIGAGNIIGNNSYGFGNWVTALGAGMNYNPLVVEYAAR